METYCKKRISYIISKSDLPTEKGLYELDEAVLTEAEFAEKIKLYSIDNLQIISNVMQDCMDVLSDKSLNGTKDAKVSNQLTSYYECYKKRQKKINERIAVLSGYLSDIKMYTLLMLAYINDVQSKLNFQKFLESYSPDINLRDIFNYYRREGTYKNENIISAGLTTNTDVIKYAEHLMDFAQKEAIKAGTPQITVTNSLNNLLAIPEFEPLLDDFEVGNWIKIRTNIDDSSEEDTIYNLRLLSYTISFDDIQNIDVEFSTATKTWSGIRDINEVVESAQSMATSFGYISKQIDKSVTTDSIVNHWVSDGLDMTNQRIVNNADNQNLLIDQHGLLARSYDDLADLYDPCQLKIINNGLYTTHDNWETIDAALGKFAFKDPANNWEETETYGIIAKKIVGEQILGEDLMISNAKHSLQFTENGLEITNGKTSLKMNPNDTAKLFSITNSSGVSTLVADANGNLDITGTIHAKNGEFTGEIISSATISGGKISGAEIEGGSINIGKGNFQVNNYGDVYAKTLSSEGMIHANNIVFHYITETENKEIARIKSFENLLSIQGATEFMGNVTIYSGNMTGTLNGCAATLGNSGNVGLPMTFNYSGQSGTPAWVWGSNTADGSNNYVYNPANFSVKKAESADTSKCVYTHIKSSKNEYGDRFHCRITQKGEFRPDDVDTTEHDDTTFPIYSLMDLGNSSYRWNTLYAASSTINTSDRNLKDSIQHLTDKHLEFFLLLQPVSFTFKEGTSGRTHIGFISQDVETAMAQVGLTDLDFAGFCKDIKVKSYIDDSGNEAEEPILDENGNPEYIYSLRYEEFIALNTFMIQRLWKKVADLENRLEKLSNE